MKLIFCDMKKTVFMIMTVMAAVSCGGRGEKVPAIDITNFDTSVAPSEDFYRYATGGWQQKNPLKPEYSRFGSFDMLNENNQKRLNDLFVSMQDMKTVPGSSDQKIADLYRMAMDSTRLNSEGAAPLKPYIDDVMSVGDKESLILKIAEIHKNGDNPFFGVYVSSDAMDSDSNVLYLDQSGLGMGDRDYYIDPANAALKEGYRNFLVKVLTLAGVPDAEKVADDAVEVEENIAEASWSKVQMRDVQKMYNPMSSEQIGKAYPSLKFPAYLEAMGIAPQEKVIVGEPSYFKAIDRYISKTPVEKLRNYLLGQVVKGACSSLSDDFYMASFEFFQKQMAGVKEPKARWKRAMAVPNSILSEAVGKMYVDRYFSPEDKERMSEMVANIQAALSEHIASLDWMSDATKAKAQEKLSNFTVKIGYPDKWKDYSTLTIDPALSYYQNMVNAMNWYSEDNLSKLGKPVDKAQWYMSPQTVNAYYSPTSNEICFPAAILQPPFYNPDADDAVNYGAIGVVISHEMTHGFDDQGRHFDKDGNMTDWWTPEDAAAFKAKTDILVEQFNEVEVLPGMHADGALCLGENIADQGGLRVAYTAMKNSFAGVEPAPIDGFTAEQRFYLAYATLWAQNITDEEIARLTKLDVHSLGNNRVNVTLKNIDTFFDAFGIKEGDRMFRPESERVVIW